MSSHVELDLAPAYALGSLDDAEKAEFEKHLRTCSECQAAVAAAAPVVGAIGLSAPAEPLPPGSGDKLVALFRAEKASGLFRAKPPEPTKDAGSGPSSSSSSGALVALACAIVAAGMGVAAFQARKALDAEHARADGLQRDISQLEDTVRRAQDDRARLESQLKDCHERGEKLDGIVSLVVRPTSRILPFKQNGGFAGNATVTFDPKTRELALSTKEMPALAAGKVYKLWAFTKQTGGTPQPLGAFDASGGFHMDHGPAGDVQGFAVSIEASPGNVQAPSKEIVLLPG